MNGSVREVRPGYWQLRVYAGIDPVTRKPRQRTKGVHARSKREAESHLPQFIVDLKNTGSTATQGTVAHLLDEVLAHLRNLDREPTTLRGYAGIAKQVRAAIGDVRLTDLTPQHLNAYYAHKRRDRVSSGTIWNHHRFIHRALALAVKWEWLPANTADRADPPPVYRTDVELPENDTVTALVEIGRADQNEHLWFALLVAAALGCRRGELCGLRWSDIDLETGRIIVRRAVKHVTGVERDELRRHGLRKGYELTVNGLLVGDVKTHKVRKLTTGPSMLVALNAHHAKMRDRAKWAGVVLSPDAYVLSDETDGSVPWRPDRVTKGQERVRKLVGYTGRLQDLRHWNTSELLDAGEDITVAAERNGHSTEIARKVYAHMKSSGDQRAAGIIDDSLFGKDELRSRRKGA